ncbi:MAG: class I SAM-dependent methyltransferase [Chloroflexi bacterium]|nr:class I SAM-dependent methyltransferase [Chloroflexota bacterium]
MPHSLRPAQYVLAMQGLALARRWLRPNMEAEVEELLASTRALARDSEQWPPLQVEDYTAEECYSLQQETYDQGWNPLIEAEQYVLASLLPPDGAGQRALDAACGTGRWAEWLVAHGYTVTGTDASEPMLAVARSKVPTAEFQRGTLEALPVEIGAFDLAICALALAFGRDIRQPVAELARAVKPNGRVFISDVHPVSVMLGDSVLFTTSDGGHGVTQSYVHWHSKWLDAFAAAGLRVVRCLDVPWQPSPWGGEWYLREGETRSPGQLMGDVSTLAKEGVPACLIWQLERL